MKKIVVIGIILTALLSTIGCAEKAVAPAVFKTYSKYGFSFEYPKNFSISEMGFLLNEADDNSGIVQVKVVENEESELFQTAWMKMMPNIIAITPGGLEGYLKDMLEEAFVGMEGAAEGASLERGELVETTKAGHQMFYQYYSITTTEGDKHYGI